MDYKEFIQSAFDPMRKYQIFYDVNDNVNLIVKNDGNYLNEQEMFECISIMPSLYDFVVSLKYEQLIDANGDIGGVIRSIFGLFDVSNPHSDHSTDITHEMSPENISFRVLKIIWYNSHRI